MSGRKIIEVLDEAIAWIKGDGTARVTWEDGTQEELTAEQYHDRLAQREVDLHASRGENRDAD